MQSSAADQNIEIYDIYGFWHVPFWQQSWFLICIALLIGCMLLICAYFFYKRYKKNRPAAPAWHIALKELEDLKKENMLKKDMSEQYYVRLTQLLKSFMSETYKKDIRSMTDKQVISYLESHPSLYGYKEKLSDIFNAGELIKFAAQDALEQQMLTDWQQAYAFVTQVKNALQKASSH